MFVTIPGIFENGIIKMSEMPVNIEFSKVLVTLIPEESSYETWKAMKLSKSSFDEWDDPTGAIYGDLYTW